MNLRRATADDLDAVVALQRAAYARNRTLLGVEPLPLQADYAAILRDMEVWLAEGSDDLEGVLILDVRTDDLLIWSVATAPDKPSAGTGRALLAAADARARDAGRGTVRLYTGAVLTHLVAWYGRHGFSVERHEVLPDRTIVHMVKVLEA